MNNKRHDDEYKKFDQAVTPVLILAFCLAVNVAMWGRLL